MLFSYNWLTEFVDDLPPNGELAERLTMTGTEVESVTDLSGGITGVVTAEVLAIEKHPNADKLSLCEVRTADGDVQIVCGAKNMAPGDKVALALSGARLPGGVKIKKSKIRGVESNGMMCSEVELGIADTSDGIMILSKDTPVGLDAIEVLGLKDSLLDVGITPNRADLLSIRGLAREIGAVTGAAFKDREVTLDDPGPPVDNIVSVSIEDGALCPRYCARVIKGVSVGPSPEHITRRLSSHGIRPVNNVVDITNYVLLELGSPLHAFDLSKLAGGTITVRPARGGESIETIDNRTRQLEEGMLVIADSEGPVAVAGVMGGAGTEVGDSTVDILLEGACFEAGTVRRTSRKLNLSTDSSYRFERGVDVENVRNALDTAARLIAEVAGGVVAEGAVDKYREGFRPRTISFRLKRAREILGIEIGLDEVEAIFKRLGMDVQAGEEGILTVDPPSYRLDLESETDLLEEAARLFGYDLIPTTLPVASLMPGVGTRTAGIKRTIIEVLTNAGLFEVQNYSFVGRALNAVSTDKAGVEIINPLSEDQVVMRSGLLPSLLENLKTNLARKNEFVRIFEVAPVFEAAGEAAAAGGGDDESPLPAEKWKVAGLLYGARWPVSWNNPREDLDFYDLTGLVERLMEGVGIAGPLKLGAMDDEGQGLFHPGKSARIELGPDTGTACLAAGRLGEAHPDIGARFDLRRPAFLFELDIEAMAGASGRGRSYSPLARFPESARDIAFIVDENIECRKIISTIKKINTKLIEKVELFDVYYGGNIPGGKRSMALRVIYRSAERTLTQPEVEDIHSKVIGELAARFGVEIRGEGQKL